MLSLQHTKDKFPLEFNFWWFFCFIGFSFQFMPLVPVNKDAFYDKHSSSILCFKLVITMHIMMNLISVKNRFKYIIQIYQADWLHKLDIWGQIDSTMRRMLILHMVSRVWFQTLQVSHWTLQVIQESIEQGLSPENFCVWAKYNKNKD